MCSVIRPRTVTTCVCCAKFPDDEHASATPDGIGNGVGSVIFGEIVVVALTTSNTQTGNPILNIFSNYFS
jgi:hypothetical protein